MKSLKVNIPGREYDIIMDEGLLDRAGQQVQRVFRGEKIFVVTDTNVEPLYGKQLIRSLQAQGFEVDVCTVPAGESSKCEEQLFELYNRMLNFKMTRSDLVIALGGGVIGDLTGFAAATLFRGIPFIQMPTTLLSQVDSSVGGKVAIDLPQGKNLVGAFYQPKMVLMDPLTLNTLSDRVWSDGMAEVIKYGAIRDAALFEELEKIKNRQEWIAKFEKIVYTCCDIKRKVVEEDELDTGGRMILNFGHTFGHAIEKQYHFETYTHGEAVAVGMVMACGYGEKIGITPRGTKERMERILRTYHLPTEVPVDRTVLQEAVSVDKKGEGNQLHLILLRDIGQACIQKINKADLVL
ncbi:3-dehydroquinate synthase [Ructibacterium gallinarum]|uniref:3-dehydroquinate synthase n=1 Tax=Ructibacterium gallinarum TaxID=2779355 RepID=A0A9D5LX54_9FIRM|nr:3-dehydroquinate synthase [Ructibacterium gallinarum]MBE5039451.1 3-dehydroquinate synthase [Ructibacterium gallinarum]